MLLCWPCYTITSPNADQFNPDHLLIGQQCDESRSLLLKDQHTDNVCYDTAAHYQCFRLAKYCSCTVVIPREDVRGHHMIRAKVGILVKSMSCHDLRRHLQQASGGLVIAATFSVTA